jgi:hypothetical protein
MVLRCRTTITCPATKAGRTHVFVPADLMLDATRSLATSALPNAPVEPDLPSRPSRIRTVLRALLHRGDGQRGDRDQAHRPADTDGRDIQQDTGEIPGTRHEIPASNELRTEFDCFTRTRHGVATRLDECGHSDADRQVDRQSVRS